jgi:hypothetical protein
VLVVVVPCRLLQPPRRPLLKAQPSLLLVLALVLYQLLLLLLPGLRTALIHLCCQQISPSRPVYMAVKHTTGPGQVST